MMNSLVEIGLTNDEIDVIHQCLTAVVDGPFFEDWEFQTLFGIDRAVVSSVLERWPNINLDDSDAVSAINGSLGNIAGYPHGDTNLFKKYISTTLDYVGKVFFKWRKCLEDNGIDV